MIENEIKFVLHNYEFLEKLLIRRYGWADIRQGYLSPNTRIREITYQNLRLEYIYSYKQRLPNGRNIEIEDFVAKDDFYEAWDFTEQRLSKRRASVFFEEEQIRWDIDFPRWPSGNKYFAMAEVEMPGKMELPPFILPEIKDFIVYEVPRSDSRFSARNLSDENHARKMAVELKLWGLVKENALDETSTNI